MRKNDRDKRSVFHQIIKLWRHSKCLVVMLALSILVSVLYILSIDSTEWFDNASYWFGLLNQIAIGYIVSFVFYIVQVYIPREKSMVLINGCIERRRNELCEIMYSFFKTMSARYMDSIDVEQFDTESFVALLNKIGSKDSIGELIMNPYTGETVPQSVWGWYRNYMHDVDKLIDDIFIHYSVYIKPEFATLMEEVKKSNLHDDHIGGVIFALPEEKKCGRKYIVDTVFEEYYGLLKKMRLLDISV